MVHWTTQAHGVKVVCLAKNQDPGNGTRRLGYTKRDRAVSLAIVASYDLGDVPALMTGSLVYGKGPEDLSEDQAAKEHLEYAH